VILAGAALFAALCAAQPDPLGGATEPGGWLLRGWHADLNLELAIGRDVLGADDARWFGRVRAGVTRVLEPLYLSAGLIYTQGADRPAAFGAQAEVMDMGTALQLQVGAALDLDGAPAAHLALGWQVFGAEVELRWPNGPAELLVVGKLRVPVSWLVYWLVDDA